DPADQRNGHQESQNERAGANGTRESNRRRHAPLGDRPKISSGQFRAKYRQLFAQIEPRLQLSNGGLARANLLASCRRPQPVSERVFSLPGLGRAEELEERARAEEVEIERVGVLLVLEAGPRLPRAAPAFF